jgi:hypothetical protein
MPSPRALSFRTMLRWGLPVATFCAGLAVAQLPEWRVATPAHAATTLSPVDKLIIKDDIRERIALYALLADGDGAGGRKRDLRTLAYTLMTPDVVSIIYTARGDPPIELKGRERVAQSPPEVDPEHASKIAGRHYVVETLFDEVTPTTAKTRTTAVYHDATRNTGGVDCKKVDEKTCGGVPVRTVLWVYHMDWRKTPEGWQIFRNTLRDDN